MKSKRIFLLAAAPFLAHALVAQITTDNSLSPQEYVEQVLIGSGVSVSNVTYNGQPNVPGNQPGIGSFTSTSTLLPLASGLVLATGDVLGIPANGSGSGGSGVSGDADLLALSGQSSINDISILEFDFVPTGDTIRFNFVFASNEYTSFTCSSFNDAFGFFLSGPGISGPYTNNAKNIALIPNTNVPIAINTVNSGTPSGSYPASNCALADPNWQSNSIYFVPNSGGQDLVYNGLTVPLTAQSEVECGQTYHIKLAIGDAMDSAFDSGVFLEGGSFSSSPFIPSLTPGPGIVGTNTILESCFDVTINFVRTGDTTEASVIEISAGGVALPGVDYYPPFPDSLFFPAGVDQVPFTFNAPIDPDSTENIILTLTSFSTCAGAALTNTFEFFIESAPPLTAAGTDINIQCGESVQLAADIAGGYGPYTIDWSNGAQGQQIDVAPTEFTSITATITDTCGTTAAALFNVGLVELPPLSMNLIGSNTLMEGCESNQINIIRPNGITGDITIQLTFDGEAQNNSDFNLPGSVVITDGNFNVLLPFDPLDDGGGEDTETVMVIGTYTDACGRSVDAAVLITILEAPPILITGNDYVVDCDEADSLLVSVNASGGFNDQLTITWGADGSVTGSEIWIPVQNTGGFLVTATDPCGRTAQTTVNVVVNCELIIPNVFTPNNDGLNDLWTIEGIIYTTNVLKVFNRWGQVVFETKNYRNTWRATDLPDGTYFYEIIVDGHEKPYTGHLTILRN